VVGELSVRAAAGRELPAGEIGEVWMRRSAEEPGPYRYLGAQPREAEDGWQSVGDMGHVDAEGYLFLADRLADLILVGGANVYPAEVEAALDEHPLVQSSCVIGLPDPEYGEVVHAIVQPTGPVSDEELFAFLAERLVRYKVPRTIERVDRSEQLEPDLATADGPADVAQHQQYEADDEQDQRDDDLECGEGPARGGGFARPVEVHPAAHGALLLVRLDTADERAGWGARYVDRGRAAAGFVLGGVGNENAAGGAVFGLLALDDRVVQLARCLKATRGRKLRVDTTAVVIIQE